MIEAAGAEFASRKEGERIDFRTGDASEILDELVSKLEDAEESEKFDFVFIDAAKSLIFGLGPSPNTWFILLLSPMASLRQRVVALLI